MGGVRRRPALDGGGRSPRSSRRSRIPFATKPTAGGARWALLFLVLYAACAAAWLLTRRNLRPGEEHGSARWGDARRICHRYRGRDPAGDKLLTRNFRMSYDTHAHRRSMNTLVVGGSGAGKTRGFSLPNACQANTSMVVLDPKGEIVRAVGGLLESRGYEVRVLDLVRMERSHCYNPLSYIESDADAQRLNTNLFKATTPKGAQSQDPFWDTAAGMLHLALLLYLVHEAPPEERNYATLMEMLRAGEGDAFISAGSTGALLSGATLLVKRVRGIRRAAMAPLIPTAGGDAVLVDCGANIDCTPEYLLQFAYIGNFYARHALKLERPRVALLNIGAEESKGMALQKEAYALLQEAGEAGHLNFIGNIEAKECS